MKEILKAFLRTVIRNPKDYSCIDNFMASDEYKKLQTPQKESRCRSCNEIVAKGYAYCSPNCYEKRIKKIKS